MQRQYGDNKIWMKVIFWRRLKRGNSQMSKAEFTYVHEYWPFASQGNVMFTEDRGSGGRPRIIMIIFTSRGIPRHPQYAYSWRAVTVAKGKMISLSKSKVHTKLKVMHTIGHIWIKRPQKMTIIPAADLSLKENMLLLLLLDSLCME